MRRQQRQRQPEDLGGGGGEGTLPALSECQSRAMEAVFQAEAAGRSVVTVQAGPGCGKSTFLVHLAERIIASSRDPDGGARVSVIAYNRSAADEMKKRLDEALTPLLRGGGGSGRRPCWDAKTFHSLGMGLLRRDARIPESFFPQTGGGGGRGGAAGGMCPDRLRAWPHFGSFCEDELRRHAPARPRHGVTPGRWVAKRVGRLKKNAAALVTVCRSNGWRLDHRDAVFRGGGASAGEGGEEGSWGGPVTARDLQDAADAMSLPFMETREIERALPIARQALLWLAESPVSGAGPAAAGPAAAGRMDYLDMLWLPVRLGLEPRGGGGGGGGRPWLLVDEAQDMNGCMRALVRMHVAAGYRVVAVGDPDQSINGFMGAEPDVMDLLSLDDPPSRGPPRPRRRHIPLQETHRLPASHTELARSVNPSLLHLPTAPRGVIRGALVEEMVAGAGAGDLVVCRVNGPLYKIFFALRSRGPGFPPVHCLRGAPEAVKRLERRAPSLRLEDLRRTIDRRHRANLDKLHAGVRLDFEPGVGDRRRHSGQEEEEEGGGEEREEEGDADFDIDDSDDDDGGGGDGEGGGPMSRARRRRLLRKIEQDGESLDVLDDLLAVPGCRTVRDACALFPEKGPIPDGAIVVSTVHRAKGREAGRVWVVLEHEAMRRAPDGGYASLHTFPSRLGAMSDADLRVWYVAVTRSKREMVFVGTRDADRHGHPPHGGRYDWLEPYLPAPPPPPAPPAPPPPPPSARCPVCRSSGTGVLRGEVPEGQRVFANARDDECCIVCMGDPADTVLVPCGHLCMCAVCFSRLAEIQRRRW